MVENTPAPAELFQREDRFIVIKRKKLSAVQETALRAHMARMDISTVECVVVESDWPEYETVWGMIERRVTGQHAAPLPLVEAVAKALASLTAFPNTLAQHAIAAYQAHMASDGVAPSYFIKPSAVVGNMRFLARHFEQLLAMPSDQQPHYYKGVRPFSNGDLRDLADACATAANDLCAAMRAAATTPQPDPRDAVSCRWRAALRDIADAEAIPNDAVAFIWCQDVARTALANSEGKANG